MLATARLLGIANPQSIKRLGHFLTADYKSAGTPNGGKAYPALPRMGISGAMEISGATGSPEHKVVRSFFDGGLQIRRDA